jgi:hypothetical protein
VEICIIMLYFTLISNFGNDIAIVKAGSHYHLSLIFEYFAITFYIIYRMTRRIIHNNSTRQEFFLSRDIRARCSGINHSTSRDRSRVPTVQRENESGSYRNCETICPISASARGHRNLSRLISLFLALSLYPSPPRKVALCSSR